MLLIERGDKMFGIEFGNLAFNCEVSEQILCIVVAGKNETTTIDEFIQKALDYQIENDFSSSCDAEEYRNCVFAYATDSDVKWLHDIIEGMNRKVSFEIGEPIKILTGTKTVFDNSWVIETKEMFYYIFWGTTA